MDVCRLALRDRSVDRIEALHLVEHLGYLGTLRALCEWRRVLRPGARLVVETPDFPETARRFVAADFEGRALLANWIFGLESPGMAHRFGFESSLLAQVLSRGGFVRVREEPARTHPAFPGLRLVAVRSDAHAHDVHAAFVRLLFDRDLAGDDQAVAVELVHGPAQDVHRAFSRRPVRAPRLPALLVRLAAADPRLARAALDAAGDALPERTRRSWNALLSEPEVAALPAGLTAELHRNPPRPGLMEAAFRSVTGRARAWLAARLLDARPGRRSPTVPPFAPEVGATAADGTPPEVAVPFLPAGLARAARNELARGLRRFAGGELDAATPCLERAAALDADSPLPFWNLARLEAARGRHAVALARFDDAILTAERRRSPALERLRRERARLAAERPVSTRPVGPFEAGLEEEPE
ncbi:MAG: hypothetical protein JXB32_01030 [Deltaproteobacteria bacterium]|nr:hypothetical protein [Deltaproteobacteria bacterium]